MDTEKLRRDLATARADALRVHDSPVRSDRLYADLERISRALAERDEGDERLTRAAASVADAMRNLRLDDDGREAARHLQKAADQFEVRERKPSPFLDDP